MQVVLTVSVNLLLSLINNSFGLQPAEQLPDFTLEPGASKNVSLDILVNENPSNKAPGTPITVDCALKTSLGIFVFQIPVMLSVLITKSSTLINVKEVRALWQQIETEKSMYHPISNLSDNLTSPQTIKDRLYDNNIVFVEEGRNENGAPCLYFNATTTNKLNVIIQLTFKNGD